MILVCRQGSSCLLRPYLLRPYLLRPYPIDTEPDFLPRLVKGIPPLAKAHERSAWSPRRWLCWL